MFEFLATLFETTRWPPRWQCGDWSESLGWLHIISDAFIFSAYVAIPLVLGYFVLKRGDVVFPRVFWLFVAFIFACGTTHLVEAIIFWEPVYRFAGVLKLVTASVSWMTVFAMIQIVPQALELPGLAAVNAQLEKEVKERRSAQENVARTNSALAKRNEELQQFVYTVSHDLKSPLVTTRGFIGVLREDLEDGNLDAVQDAIQRMDAATARMDDLIGDLLQLSTAGNVRYDLQDVDVEQLLLTMKADLAESGYSGEVELVSPIHHVTADRKRLTQVFDNLITNALKYGCSENSSTIQVSSEVTSDETIFHVSDSGPGIPQEFYEKVFLPFERLQSDGEGTGVGLAIAKRVVENHGGRIWVSASPAGGATVSFSIPRTSPADA